MSIYSDRDSHYSTDSIRTWTPHVVEMGMSTGYADDEDSQIAQDDHGMSAVLTLGEGRNR